MKKILPILLSLLLLASCSFSPSISGSLPKGTSETVTEPEKAPADTSEQPADPPAKTPEETPSESAEEAEKEVAEETEEPPETEAPQAAAIRVYYGNDNADALLSKEVTLPELTPEAVANELIAVSILPEGTLVNRLEVLGPILYLDLSYEFFAKLQTMGTAGEWITVGSVTNTFLEAYGIDSLILTVNGSVIETGHTVYDFPLTRFENPEAAVGVTLTVYRGDDNAEYLISEDVTVAEITPAVITEQLIAAGVLTEGCAAHYAEMDGTALFVDFNDAFKAPVCTMGTTGEWIILSSVANTFLGAYDAEECYITVNNSVLETGHNVYDFPLTFTP